MLGIYKDEPGKALLSHQRRDHPFAHSSNVHHLSVVLDTEAGPAPTCAELWGVEQPPRARTIRTARGKGRSRGGYSGYRELKLGLLVNNCPVRRACECLEQCVKCCGGAEEGVFNLPGWSGAGRISEGSLVEVVKYVCVGEGHSEYGESMKKESLYITT